MTGESGEEDDWEEWLHFRNGKSGLKTWCKRDIVSVKELPWTKNRMEKNKEIHTGGVGSFTGGLGF